MVTTRVLRLGLATVLITILMAFAAGPVGAAGSNNTSGGEGGNGGTGLAIPSDLAAAAQGRFSPEALQFLGGFPLQVGDTESGSPTLDDTLPDDGHVFLAGNADDQPGTLNVTIQDCCIMGDTMVILLFVKQPDGSVTRHFDVCTSPDTCNVQVGLEPGGFALGITGYLQTPGGFPAGYSYEISLQ